jgi:opacity protein-like surface antigen
MRTRNFLFVLLTAMVCTFAARAQETHFGVMAGVHGSNFTSDIPDFKSDMKIGFHIGGGVDLGLSDNFSINADLLYSIMGAKQTTTTEISLLGTTTKSVSDETVTVSYLQIPILARYKLESGLYFNAGPYIGIRMGYKDDADVTTTTTTGGSSTSSSSSSSTTDDTGLTSTDLGLKLGLGYKMESGLDFGLNYGLGFGNLLDKDYGGDTYYIHNSTIGLTIGYWFGGK